MSPKSPAGCLPSSYALASLRIIMARHTGRFERSLDIRGARNGHRKRHGRCNRKRHAVHTGPGVRRADGYRDSSRSGSVGGVIRARVSLGRVLPALAGPGKRGLSGPGWIPDEAARRRADRDRAALSRRRSPVLGPDHRHRSRSRNGVVDGRATPSGGSGGAAGALGPSTAVGATILGGVCVTPR